MYLYRHSLELELKNLVRFGSGLLDRNEKLSNALSQHNLYELWNLVKKICEVAWPNSAPDESISRIEELLLKLHAIDASGQNLRYSTDKAGNASQSSFPKFVELKNVSVIVGQVISLLNAMHDALGDFSSRR